MILALKSKRKNVNRELGKLYEKKRNLLNQILKLEETKLNLKIKMTMLKIKRVKQQRGVK